MKPWYSLFIYFY